MPQRVKPRDQRTPETQTVHVRLLLTFSLTASSLSIYRSRAPPLAARRWEALDAPKFVSAAPDATEQAMPFYRPSDLQRSSDRCDTDAAPHHRLCHPSRFMVDRRNLRWRGR